MQINIKIWLAQIIYKCVYIFKHALAEVNTWMT